MFFMKNKKRLEIIDNNMSILLADLKSLRETVVKVDKKIGALSSQIDTCDTAQKEAYQKNIGKLFEKISEMEKEIKIGAKSNFHENNLNNRNIDITEINQKIDILKEGMSDVCEKVELWNGNREKEFDSGKLEKILSDKLDKQYRELGGVFQAIRTENNSLVQSIYDIKKELENEKQTNQALLKLVQEQGSILRELIEKDTTNKCSVITSLKEEKTNVTKADAVIKTSVSNEPILTGSHIHNLHYLENCLKYLEDLRREYTKVLGNEPKNMIYFKILSSYENEMKELIEDVRDDEEIEAYEIAKKFVDIIKSTIIKNFTKDELKKYLDEYFLKCKLQKIEIEVGKKIGEETYKYIGNPLQKPVDNPSLDRVVISKKHDAYFITYKEEDSIIQKVISGECEIGVLTE